MPVRDLEKELSIQKVIQAHPLSKIEKGVIGIDGAWLIRKHFSPKKRRQVLIDGGARKELDGLIRGFIKSMENVGCRVIWLWNGVTPRTGNALYPYSSFRTGRIIDGWNNERRISTTTTIATVNSTTFNNVNVSANNVNNNNTTQESAWWYSAVGYEEIKRRVNEILRSFDVEILNAPYEAAAQGAYMAKHKYIDTFFGTTDYLLFSGSDTLIVDFAFVRTENTLSITEIFTVQKKSVADAFQIDEEQLVDLLLLCGCEYCPTTTEYAVDFKIENIVKLCLSKSTVKEHLEHLSSTNEGKEYLKKFLIGKACVKYHPVTTEKETLICLSDDEPPHDLDIIFGEKLPDNMYVEFSKGIYTLDYIRGLIYKKRNVICDNEVYNSVKDAVNLLYTESITIQRFTRKYAPQEIFTGITTKESLEDIADTSIYLVSGLDQNVQWLIFLMEKNDKIDMNRIFVLNNIGEDLGKEEKVVWEVFEFAESVSFALDIIQNLRNKEREEQNQSNQSNQSGKDKIPLLDSLNGWRMYEILQLLKLDPSIVLSPIQIECIKKNMGFINNLLFFYKNNKMLSSSLERNLEKLAFHAIKAVDIIAPVVEQKSTMEYGK